jgi:hypothetical protein
MLSNLNLFSHFPSLLVHMCRFSRECCLSYLKGKYSITLWFSTYVSYEAQKLGELSMAHNLDKVQGNVLVTI